MPPRPIALITRKCPSVRPITAAVAAAAASAMTAATVSPVSRSASSREATSARTTGSAIAASRPTRSPAAARPMLSNSRSTSAHRSGVTLELLPSGRRLRFQLAAQPGLRDLPLALDGRVRHLQGCRGFLDGEPHQVAHLGDLGVARLDVAQPGQRLVEDQE